MTFEESTKAYEEWVRKGGVFLLAADLKAKRRKLKRGAFSFLRGTFYRWCQLWPTVVEEMIEAGKMKPKAPEIPAVGDLHIENFGTWRDREGRLIWGINDFDEACSLPYVDDLVRLATSAGLAESEKKVQFSLPSETACTSILEGYREGLETGGRPFVLADRHHWLWQMARSQEREPREFWKHLESAITPLSKEVPSLLAQDLRTVLDSPGPSALPYPVTDRGLRQAGVGSLGRIRWVQIYEDAGGKFAREAKMRAASAWFFAHQRPSPKADCYATILQTAIRVNDPAHSVSDRWVFRRLAPDCNKIELGLLEKAKDKGALLRAMGFETANIHLGSGQRAQILRHLRTQPQGWLLAAARKMMRRTTDDFESQ